MRIGAFEIRVMPGGVDTGRMPVATESGQRPELRLVGAGRMKEEDVRSALRVADTEPWWRAVMQEIGDAEESTIRAARNVSIVPNECAAHVAAGEALDLLRKRLERLRSERLKI